MASCELCGGLYYKDSCRIEEELLPLGYHHYHYYSVRAKGRAVRKIEEEAQSKCREEEQECNIRHKDRNFFK